MQIGITNKRTLTIEERQIEPRLTQKGQVTIPQEIRQRLGLKPRDRVRFEIEGDVVVVKTAPSRIARWFGSVTPPPEIAGWSAEQLRTAYEEGIAEDVSRETEGISHKAE